MPSWFTLKVFAGNLYIEVDSLLVYPRAMLATTLYSCCYELMVDCAEVGFEKWDFESDSDASLPTETTLSDTDMSEYSRYILANRFSRPQLVDQWDVYSLHSSFNVGECRWVWKKAVSCPAADPLSRAPFCLALDSALRHSARQHKPYRMIYREKRLNDGIDAMGYKLMQNALILRFAVKLIDYKTLDVMLEGSGESVMKIPLDDICTYTSSDCLKRFIDFNVRFQVKKAAFTTCIHSDSGDNVIGRFTAVCSDQGTQERADGRPLPAGLQQTMQAARTTVERL